MRKLTILSSLILCLLLSALPGRSLSQGRGPQSPAEFQRLMEQQQRQFKQMQEEWQRQMREQWQRQMQEQQAKNEATQKLREQYYDEAQQQALDATGEQWQVLRPRLERIKRLQAMPHIDIATYVIGGSGSYQFGAFTETSDGGRSTANASGGYSATRGVNSTSDSTTRSGRAGGYGRSFAEGGANLRVQTPGPVRKQVGDVYLGWQWQRPSLNKERDKLTEGDKACERLLDTLETEKPGPVQIRQQLESLRQARQRQQAELQQARQQLRAIVTPEQEAKLILMGYLD
jgi:flagellar motor protein MotB